MIERFAAAGVAADARSPSSATRSCSSSRRRRRSSSSSFRDYYGPTMNAFEAAEANGRADELFAELDALFDAQNQATRRLDQHPGDLPPGHGPALSAAGVE